MSELVCSSCGREESLSPVPLPDGRLVPLCPTCSVATAQVIHWMEEQHSAQQESAQQRQQLASFYLLFGAFFAGLGTTLAYTGHPFGWGAVVFGGLMYLAGVFTKVVS